MSRLPYRGTAACRSAPPARRGRWSWACLFGSGALLAGCASTAPPVVETVDPPQDPVPAPTVVLPAEPTAYELRQRERATNLARQGKLAEAALTWELLATIRPRVAEYRERLAEVQKQIDSGVAERLQRGEQAAARGQIDAAMQQFLAALSLQPDNARAADALRAVERERVKRNHLGKLSRNTLGRRAMNETEDGPNDAPVDAAAQPAASPGSVVPRRAASPRPAGPTANSAGSPAPAATAAASIKPTVATVAAPAASAAATAPRR